MRRFAIVVIALVLAPGLKSAVVQTRPEAQITTLPGVLSPDVVYLPWFPESTVPELRPLPIPEVPVLRPQPVPEPEVPVLRPQPVPEPEVPVLRPQPVPEPEDPVLRPQPVPEVEAVHPELISINPCDACFEYMSTLIDQLTEVAVPEQQPEVPEVGLPEPVVPRPLPESVPEDLRPLPTPEEEEIEINPIPLPVAPEVGVLPLPLPIAPEVEARPLPAEIPGLVVSSEALPDDY